jgi:hypothetical protein
MAVSGEVCQCVGGSAAIIKSDEKWIYAQEMEWRRGGEAREFDGGLFAAPKPDVGVPHLRKNSYEHKENRRSRVGAGALQDLDGAVFRRSDCNILAENNCL